MRIIGIILLDYGEIFSNADMFDGILRGKSKIQLKLLLIETLTKMQNDDRDSVTYVH